MTPRAASERAFALTREFESLRLAAYLDGGGVPTIGYGHTAGVRMGMVWTRAQADEALQADMREATETIARHVDADVINELPQLAYDALCDFVFNLGSQALINLKNKTPTGIARALRDKRFGEVPAQMMRWVYDNGKEVRGLKRRRTAEAALWTEGFGDSQDGRGNRPH